jgi:hypothetical protein
MRRTPRSAVVRAIVVPTAALLAIALAAVPAVAQASPTLTAMQAELQRSMADLRLKDEPAPYYIAYGLDDLSATRITAQLGAVFVDAAARSRRLRVEVRVGDYQFDSSRFISQQRGRGTSLSGVATVSVPLDEDVDSLRREVWLATDEAYKRAVTIFARKKAAFQNRVAATDSLPDFSRETPVESIHAPFEPGPIDAAWGDHARAISLALGDNPDVQTSEVSIATSRGTRYFINSEGFRLVEPIQMATLRMTADAQAEDGMQLREVFTRTEKRLEDLPAAAELVASARDMSSRLSARRTAPVGEEYTGPVLIEQQASAEFVAQTLLQLMLARRAPDADNLRMARIAQNQVTPFLTRIGLRVLPDTFLVRDTPSLTEFQGRPVPGAYAADEEGMLAQDVRLVERGRLVTLLTGRTPQKNLPQSNGHGRGGSVQAGVFQIESAQAIPAAELKARMLELLKIQNKPFGYIVRSIAEPDDSPVGEAIAGSPVILDAVRVTQDGREESVRGLRFANVAFSAFKDVAEASVERTLYSYQAGGSAVVSVIVPDLMFEELEIQQVSDIAQRPPIVPSPLR